MSQNLNNGSTHRDYGATSSSNTNMMSSSTTIPDVNFSGFSPTEFMSLSEDIAHNIQAVNSSSKQLEKILQILGTPRDQQSTRDKVHDINTKTNSRIESTSVDLQRLTAIVRRGDKQQKLQLEKLTNDFCNVVERYTTTQKCMAQAMRQTYTQPQMAQMQDDREADTEELIQRQQQLQQQQMQFEHDMLVDRERQIKQIESDMLDVNKIMRTITALVQAQGEEVGKLNCGLLY